MPDIASVASATQSVTLTPGLMWLKDPLDSSLGTAVIAEAFRKAPRESVGVFDGIGRKQPSFSSDGRKGWQIACTLRVEDKAAHDRLSTILESGRIVLLQDGAFPEQWYVKLVSSGDWTRIIAQDPAGTYKVRYLYRIELGFITADVP